MVKIFAFLCLALFGAHAFGEERPFLGVRFAPDAPRIEQLFAGAPAEKAGFAVGDVVRSFGETEITSTEQLQGLLKAQKPGDEVKFSVEREGEKKEITATLARHTVRYYLTQQDPPRVPGGTIQLSGGGIGGDFQQSGNFVIEGPSTVEGNFTQQWSGVLDLLVDGKAAPPLRVSGEMNLAGMLHVRLAEGLKPKLGDRIKIIAGAKGINGTFDELSLPPIGDKLGWRIEYDNIERMDDFDRDGLHDVTIVVVDPDKEMPPVLP